MTNDCKPLSIKNRAASHARAILLVSVLALLTGGCSSSEQAAREDQTGTPVRTALATLGPATAPIDTRGKIAAAKEIQLSFKTPGVVARVAVREGVRVRAGQLLAELALDEIRAQTLQADALAEKAERDLARAERLHAEEVISLEALQNARTLTEIARNAQTAARFNLRYSRIVATRDGIVLRRLIEEGELVAPGQPILLLGADDEGYVVQAALADRDLVRVSLGDQASLRLDAYPGRTLNGVLTEIAGTADALTGLFAIQVSVNQPDDLRLASGLVARLTLQPGQTSQGARTYVPVSAIVDGAGRTAHVYVNDAGIARKRAVEIDFLLAEQAALLRGVQAGEVVITEGALYLQDGEAIRVVTGE